MFEDKKNQNITHYMVQKQTYIESACIYYRFYIKTFELKEIAFGNFQYLFKLYYKSNVNSVLLDSQQVLYHKSQFKQNNPHHPPQVVVVVPDDEPLLILVTNVVVHVWTGKVGSLPEYRLDLCLFLIDFDSTAFKMCSMYLSTMIDLYIPH
jgi:hypothetical protein